MAVNPAIADLNAAVANPRADIAALDALERKLFAIRYAIDEIGSLGPVIDPPSATEERGEACSILEEERPRALRPRGRPPARAPRRPAGASWRDQDRTG